MLPVGNHVDTDAKSISHRLVAAKGFDQFFSHSPLSQIVSGDASGNCHRMNVAAFFRRADIEGMESQDKNGGPNHLRAWREYRQLSQATLAERVGTNPNVVQYLETGERGLSAKWLRRLSVALDTTPGMLLDHDPHKLDADILEIWGDASERQKRQISEIAKALLKTGTTD